KQVAGKWIGRSISPGTAGQLRRSPSFHLSPQPQLVCLERFGDRPEATWLVSTRHCHAEVKGRSSLTSKRFTNEVPRPAVHHGTRKYLNTPANLFGAQLSA